jgi:hypothetical protein
MGKNPCLQPQIRLSAVNGNTLLPPHCYRYPVAIKYALSQRSLQRLTSRLVNLGIVNAKNTSQVKQKTRVSTLNPKGYFVYEFEQHVSGFSSSISSAVQKLDVNNLSQSEINCSGNP